MANRFFCGGVVYLIAILGLLGLQLVGGMLAIAAGGLTSAMQFVLMACISLFDIFLVCAARKKTSFTPAVIGKPQAKNLGLSLAASVLTLIAAYPLVAIVEEVLTSWSLPVSTISVQGWDFLGAVITTVFLAPIGEELVFRYFLGSSLVGTRGSVAIGAAAFALMHMNPYQTVYPVLLGITLSLVWGKTGNTLYTILMHALNNALALALAFLPAIPFSWVTAEGVLIAAAVLVAGGCGVFACVRKLSEETEREKEKTDKSGWWLYALAGGICLIIWVAGCFPVAGQ